MDEEYEHDEHGCRDEACPCYKRGHDHGYDAYRVLLDRVLEYLGPAAADESLEIHRFRMDVTE